MRGLDGISGSQLGRDGAVRILCGAFTTHTTAKTWDEGELCMLRKTLQVRVIRLQIRVKRTGQMGPTEVLCLAMKYFKSLNLNGFKWGEQLSTSPTKTHSPPCVTCLAPDARNPYTRELIRSSPVSLIHR